MEHQTSVASILWHATSRFYYGLGEFYAAYAAANKEMEIERGHGGQLINLAGAAGGCPGKEVET